MPSMEWEAVIGLELHVQLLTASKLFSADAADFTTEPNTHISAISLAHPGTLPRLNRKAIEQAVKLGLACHAEITRINYFDRKNYFYPDLPKGYQITQHHTPICRGGYLTIYPENPPHYTRKTIRIHHMHLEEDAGKLLHREHHAWVDFNRAGVPLLEIVTEPDLHSPEEAAACLTALRRLVRYLGVSDGNMEEGSLRCDVNVSVRPAGTQTLGTKVEIKNLNSVRFVRKALEYEINRQIAELEQGTPITQHTRGYDEQRNITYPQRQKEMAHDYRYFPEPDLAPFVITDDMLGSIRRQMPPSQELLMDNYLHELGLGFSEAWQLTESPATVQFFTETLRMLSPAAAKTIANWLLGPIRAYLNSHPLPEPAGHLTPGQLAELIQLIENGTTNFTAAAQQLLPPLLEGTHFSPTQLAEQLGLHAQPDKQELLACVDEILHAMPDKIKQYRSGKKGLLGYFVGEVMKKTQGKANPQLIHELIRERLK
ncbi:MAG: Asp-tRNA(Asn)/Glu-tRNA(Gln) amidotransferase subunit GatB [Thermoflavifilum aggregans]|nr:Asp-tRNA(Asn)/Glu-tRNA(Gln) amidotransferase subunit GatB [Thermoflavifilum aggregans]